MQITRLHIICLCAAIQFQLIIGHPWQYPEDSQHGQPMVGSPANNGRGAQKAVTPAPYDSNGQPNTQQGAGKDSVIEQQAINSLQTNGEPGTRVDPVHNEGHNDGIEGQEIVDSVTHEPQGPDSQPNPGSSSPHNNNGNDNSNTVGTKPHESSRQDRGRFKQPSRSQTTRHICTVFTDNYDCQIKNVHLKKNQPNSVFGLSQNTQKRLTFRDSTLEYLPKSLIDAFPRVILLNLNGLLISSIESHAFESAADLETVYLEDNRLVQIDEGAFHGAKKLQMLVLSKNDITKIDDRSFDRNTKLLYLYLDRNRLTTLPAFTNTVYLKVLNASRNNLESIGNAHFGALYYLENVDVSYNRLKQLNLQQLPALLDLVDVSFNDLSELVLPPKVKHLNAKNNSLTTIIVGTQCNLEELNLAMNRLDTFPELKACRSLRKLDLSYNLFEVFTLPTSMLNLEYLSIAHNNLFEINLPTIVPKTAPLPFSLKLLDLSYNELSHASSLSVFKNLEHVLLNDNNFISLRSYANSTNFISYQMANNEWDCKEVKKFHHWTIDKYMQKCAQDMQNITGICCRVYNKPFNDRLNEILRDADFHERQNQKKCPKVESTTSNPTAVLENIRNAIASSDRARADQLKLIQDTTVRKNNLNMQLQKFKAARDRVNESKYKVTQEVEKQRQVHRVPKEGLISDKEMLKRIIKFVQEKDAFTEDLLTRRQLDTEQANNLFEEKQREVINVKNLIEDLENKLKALKAEDKQLKTDKDRLEKRVNKNASAIHGRTGQIF